MKGEDLRGVEPCGVETLLRILFHAPENDPDERLWSWSRSTAWRRVKAVMMVAGISGAHAMPKGIRHKYGINAVLNGLPETMLQELLGHSDLSTTSIYVKAVGREKRALVSRVWQSGEA